MICPQCGYDMGNKSKCMRCGYEVKTLATVDRSQKKDEDNDAKVIDPENVYITNPDDYDDVGIDDPFSMLFGDIFDPIGDLLGGLFGLDVRPTYSSRSSYIHEPEHAHKTKKDDNVVEVKKVEIYDENGELVNPEGKLKKTVNKVKDKVRSAVHHDAKSGKAHEQAHAQGEAAHAHAQPPHHEKYEHRNVHGNRGGHNGKNR